MKKTYLNNRIRQIIKNRMLGFKTPEADAQLIVDVIIPLTNKGITISRATAILEDAIKILPQITKI